MMGLRETIKELNEQDLFLDGHPHDRFIDSLNDHGAELDDVVMVGGIYYRCTKVWEMGKLGFEAVKDQEGLLKAMSVSFGPRAA